MDYKDLKKTFDVEHILAFDIETYYDKDYSLKKLTSEQYINDPRFELQYVSVSMDGKEVEGRFVDDPTYDEWIKSFEWEKSLVIAHNGNTFDFAVMKWRYGIEAKMYLDTLVMAKPLAGDNGVSLKKLAEFFGLPAKLNALGEVEGIHLSEYTRQQRVDISEYGNHDTELCLDIFRNLVVHWGYAPLLWMDYCARMFIYPRLTLDRERLEEALRDLGKRKETILAEAWDVLSKTEVKLYLKTFESIFSSGVKFASLLEQLGLKVPYKESVSLKTGKKNVTPCVAKTDPFIVQLWENDDPAIQCALHTREMLNSSIEESRLGKLLDIAKRAEDNNQEPKLPVPLIAFGARTGRNAGGGKINLQNLPSRVSKLNPKGKKCALRMSIRAPDGYNITEADFSQIEVRTIGGLAGDFVLINEFSDPDRDCYLSWGEKLDGVYRTKDSPERAIYKQSLLSLDYGAGARKLFEKLKESGVVTTMEECIRIVNTFRMVYNGVSSFWNQCGWAIDLMYNKASGTFGYRGCLEVDEDRIKLPSGRYLTYKNLHIETIIDNDREKKVYKYTVPNTNMDAIIYGSKLSENISQAVANDICVNSAIGIQKKYGFYPVLQIHDSLAYLIPNDERLNEYNEGLLDIMRHPPKWLNHIPIDAEYATGASLGELK